jgi:hypothetical protein
LRRPGGLSYPEYADIAAHSDLFESVCASRPVTAPLTIGQETVAGSGRVVTPDCFAVYRFGALRGRLLGPEDMTGAPVAVISESLWRMRLQAREDILGARLRFARQELTIVGVVRSSAVGGRLVAAPDVPRDGPPAGAGRV